MMITLNTTIQAINLFAGLLSGNQDIFYFEEEVLSHSKTFNSKRREL